MLNSGTPVTGEGYAPAHITGFFTVCRSEEPIRSGSTGAGICIAGGVKTRLSAREGRPSGFQLRCNGSPVSSPTCSYVASRMVPEQEGYAIVAEQESVLPANYGYGVSGSSALSLAISINRALGMGMSLREVASVAHVAEVVNETGLGDVLAETVGGLEVRTSPGGPGIGVARQIPLSEDYVVISTPVAEFQTRRMITERLTVNRINRLGKEALEAFLESPTVENFMFQSRRFWDGVGLSNEVIRSVLKRYESAGVENPSAKKGLVFAVVERARLAGILRSLAEGGSDSEVPPSVLAMPGGLRLIVSEIHRSGMEWESV
ncbi:MAG: pantoate kinase [Candidatus Methanosuratincola sp.]